MIFRHSKATTVSTGDRPEVEEENELSVSSNCIFHAESHKERDSTDGLYGKSRIVENVFTSFYPYHSPTNAQQSPVQTLLSLHQIGTEMMRESL